MIDSQTYPTERLAAAPRLDTGQNGHKGHASACPLAVHYALSTIYFRVNKGMYGLSDWTSAENPVSTGQAVSTHV